MLALAGPGLLCTAAAEWRAVGDQPTVAVSGATYLDAQLFFERYGLQAEWIEAGKWQRFSSAWTRIELENDSREIDFNGLRVFLGNGVIVREGRLWLDRLDAEKVFGPLLKAGSYARSARPVRRIVIDAGHGGRDGGTGNAAQKLNEKTFTLDVARRLGAILSQQGFEVVQTRTEDVYLGLAERAAAGRAAQADLFVSVHFNAAGKPTVHGIETYVMTPQHQRSTSSAKPDPSDDTAEPGNAADPWNLLLGYEVHRALIQQLEPSDRGLKRARFAVLRLAECPAVLVEAGYLSNDAEARRIASPEYRSDVAQAVANGIIAYANHVLTIRPSS